MAKTFLRTKNVGSPCESFSVASGMAVQILRTRRRCSPPISDFGVFAIRLNFVFGEADADHPGASSFSAISSSFVTVFQFLPVPGVCSIFSMVTHDTLGRAMPLGKYI